MGGEEAGGTVRWPDGATFTGEFGADGEIMRGVYTWPDGSEFEGTFRGGQPADGVLTKADGTLIRGEFGPADGASGCKGKARSCCRTERGWSAMPTGTGKRRVKGRCCARTALATRAATGTESRTGKGP